MSLCWSWLAWAKCRGLDKNCAFAKGRLSRFGLRVFFDATLLCQGILQNDIVAIFGVFVGTMSPVIVLLLASLAWSSALNMQGQGAAPRGLEDQPAPRVVSNTELRADSSPIARVA
jgi:hypothetical protein